MGKNKQKKIKTQSACGGSQREKREHREKKYLVCGYARTDIDVESFAPFHNNLDKFLRTFPHITQPLLLFIKRLKSFENKIPWGDVETYPPQIQLSSGGTKNPIHF